MTTPNGQFARPSSQVEGDKADFKILNGHLIIVFADEFKSQVPTANGPTDAVIGEIHVIDVIDPATGQPPILHNTAIFPKALVNQTKEFVGTGQPVLGTIEQGTAKPGQSAPWLLRDWTDEEAARAGQYLASHPRQAIARPAAPTPPPPAAGGWGQQTPPANAWGAQPPAQPAPGGWGQQPAAAPAPAAWGNQPSAPVQPPLPAPTGYAPPPSLNPALAQQLQGGGIDISQVPNDDAARQILLAAGQTPVA